MGYEKGPVAFFEGTRSDYQKVLKKNDTIAGFTVAAIEPAAVKLTTATNSMELHVGMQLRREDEGDWKMSEKPESLEAPPRSTTLTSTYQNYSRSNDQPAPPQQGFPDFSNPEATVAIISNVLNSVGGFQPPPGFNPDGGGDFNQRTNIITAPSSPGNVNDALERLRRRREQENNQ